MPGEEQRVERLRVQALVAVTVLLMASAELLAHRSSGSLHVLAVPVAAVGVTALARRWGISWAELGLARSTWRRGAAYGLAVAGIVLLAVAVVAVLPWTRSAFTDDRYDFGMGHALLVALVFIPLRTVIAEELVFRGILLAGSRSTARHADRCRRLLPPVRALACAVLAAPGPGQPGRCFAAGLGRRSARRWRSSARCWSPPSPGSCSAGSGCAAAACSPRSARTGRSTEWVSWPPQQSGR